MYNSVKLIPCCSRAISLSKLNVLDPSIRLNLAFNSSPHQFCTNSIAFNRIAANKGAGTPGIDTKTIDGINLKKLERYHWEYV
ncbi:MAG: hypothetical protein Q8830_03315, partial [Candidatus Phytoplasma australasiaticum]|nr:hypothetical protein [Candidatus Phytoplasma australasiaticum]